MLGRELVRPLEDDWRGTLDDVARARGWPSSRDVARLAERVRALSASYNDPTRASAVTRDAGPARLGFSFARDVPKGAAAVRELVATGALRLDGTLRVLDLGAGLGATTWGLARALEAAGGRGTIDATWVDPDAQALDVALAVARARQGRGAVEVRPTASSRGLDSLGALGGLAAFDVVLAGQLLSELDVGAPEGARLERHATLLRRWLDGLVRPDGSLVVIEPALRDRTRHLHRVHDALLEGGGGAGGGATVFAPCVHAGRCPALRHEGDWCHEDLPVDLPAWLVPVARAAGLRFEGLTFSYLVLRKDGRRLADPFVLPPTAARLRVVSGPIRSKGKREAFLCGELPGAGVVRARAMRLDRDATAATAAWDDLARGDVLTVDPAPETHADGASKPTRISRDRVVTRLGGTESR
ncbi:MAG TPA: small ribosomal subunit Rsm22 family protein [Polyangiaceae bacterium]|jgi:SAM-dependent methyltransferase